MSDQGGGNPDQRYHCANCCRDITLRLKCSECLSTDLCLECFSRGTEIGEHRRTHNYQVIDDGSFSLLTDEWGAIEEVLLLDAVEQEGLGNWEDVGRHVTTKSTKEIKDYYNDMYVNSVIGEGSIRANPHQSHLERHGGRVAPKPPEHPPVQIDQSEQSELGYLPKRDDFEQEFLQNSEKMICNLTVLSNEDQTITALKLAHIDMFNKKLKERQHRKDVARFNGLLGTKQRHIHRKKYRDERELRSKFKPFLRLMSNSDFDELMSSLKREKELKKSIAELQA